MLSTPPFLLMGLILLNLPCARKGVTRPNLLVETFSGSQGFISPSGLVLVMAIRSYPSATLLTLLCDTMGSKNAGAVLLVFHL